MGDSADKPSWPAVVGSAVLFGTVFFVLVTLGNRYVLGDDFDGGGLGSAIAVTLLWIVKGAAERRGWLPSSARPPEQE